MMTFYYELFGFDWIEGPQAFSGLPEGSEKPVLIIGTGPTQPDGEGSVPGHMNFNPAPGGRECDVTGLFTEIDMDRDLDEMLSEMEAHGGKILTDSSKNFYAKEPIHGESWEVTAVLVDPAGNDFYLWKCPSSRSWEEPETGWDQKAPVKPSRRVSGWKHTNDPKQPASKSLQAAFRLKTMRTPSGFAGGRSEVLLRWW